MEPVEASTQIVLTVGQIAAVAAALAGAASGALGLVFRSLKGLLAERMEANATARKEFEQRLEERLREIATEGEVIRELERSFLSLRAELPEKYVRREDYIRGQTVIEAKLDAISSELKVVQIQGAKREPHRQ